MGGGGREQSGCPSLTDLCMYKVSMGPLPVNKDSLNVACAAGLSPSGNLQGSRVTQGDPDEKKLSLKPQMPPARHHTCMTHMSEAELRKGQ